MKILETSRLWLREFRISDAPNMFELNSDPEVIKYTGDVSFQSLQEAETFLKNYDPYSQTGMGRWLVLRKSDQACLGWCGLKLHNNDWVDLGYRFFKRYWNQGYATEASIGCLNYGFDKLRLEEVYGMVVAENIASVKVLGKLGFNFLNEIEDGLMGNSHLYGLQRKDWEHFDVSARN
ncbi:MAG: GNAT family N-acetyltransferase [Bacteroidota bacterium]